MWPEHARYLDVYHHYQLTGERSVFAHGIHLDDAPEWQCRCMTPGPQSPSCPTSNLFLGGGLFRLPACWAAPGADGHRQRRRSRDHLQHAADAGRGLQG
ncbi:hypothetical protein LNP74_31660 [Klebsiella pneumoniae subsp. pneumoniae]|nr:hypothetical protein [Klebsiella pneumoniae subsp. pneumoniae]